MSDAKRSGVRGGRWGTVARGSLRAFAINHKKAIHGERFRGAAVIHSDASEYSSHYCWTGGAVGWIGCVSDGRSLRGAT